MEAGRVCRRLELGLSGPRAARENRLPGWRLEQESCSGPPLL